MPTAPPVKAMAQLALAGVTKRYGDRTVLDRVSSTVKPGDKVGVIGENGAGKSTLLRLLAGHEQPDNGTVSVSFPGGIGYLPQTLDLPASGTVGDAIDLALAEVRALENQLRHAGEQLGEDPGPSALATYAQLLARFEARGGYRADTWVDIALYRLGEHAGLHRARPLGTLSGGQRSRLALAATLASAPELLLLDEPTNDLDDEAADWLENHLRRHRGTLVAVTHDRHFLDRVTNGILEVDGACHTVRRYGDGYTAFLSAKASERAHRARAHEEWRTEWDRLSALVETHSGRLAAIPRKGPAAFSGAGAFRARSRAHGAMSRIRQAKARLAELTARPAPAPPEPLRFSAPVTAGTEPTGVQLDGVRVTGRLDIEWLNIEPGGRLLVTGPNGAGKTTLLRVLAGELTPDAGTVTRPGRIGHLRQHNLANAGLRPLLAAYAQGRPGHPLEYADALLATGLFRPDDLSQPVAALSVGQRRKLELARLIAGPVELLLLDEPTNHLAPDLVEELEEALAGYPGMLVIASHDRRIRREFTGTRLELGPTPSYQSRC